jgi:hypothetical protein
MWIFMPACWLLEGLSYRHSIVPDGVSYLDIASACANGHWTAAVNAYWSPAYPVLLSLVFSLLKPSPYRELTIVHCFNCLILILALCCFEYFLKGLEEHLTVAASTDPERAPLPKWAFRAILYALFFWASLYMTPPSLDTPDALVFALVLLASGIILRIAAGSIGLLRFAALGIVLGLGYLAKAAMFPLAFVFLAVALLAVHDFRRAVARSVLGLIFFLFVAGPFVLLLSKSKGRLTSGDVGRIAYAEYVDGVKLFVHWQGGPPGAGTPIHPTRKIFEMPSVYEFATPVGGSYPPWYDPSYWYEGVHPFFQLKGQLNALRHTLDDFFELLTRLSGLFAGLLVLLIWGGSIRSFASNLLRETSLWGPGIAAFGMYSLIHIESRFLSGFLIVLGAGLFSAVRIQRSVAGIAIIRSVTLAMVFVLGIQITWSVGHSAGRFASSRGFPTWEVAQALRHAGIASGDNVACIGPALQDQYWARLAGAKIVSEIPAEGVTSYWASGPEVKVKVLSLFAQAGAKAVVAIDVPAPRLADGWEPVPNTDYYVLTLSR